MSVVVRLPGALRDSTGGSTKVDARGSTLAEVLDDLDRRYPGLRSRIVDDAGELRSYVNVFIGDRDARDAGGTGAAVTEGDEVMVIPAMAGGAHPA
jgi:molybdopterin synthase sulfur carrier subunit